MTTIHNTGRTLYPSFIADYPEAEEINKFVDDKMRAFNDNQYLTNYCEKLIQNNPQVFSNKKPQETAQIIFDWFRDHLITCLKQNRDYQVLEDKIEKIYRCKPHFSKKEMDEEISLIIRSRMRVYHSSPVIDAVQKLCKDRKPIVLHRFPDRYQPRDLKGLQSDFFC